VVRAKVVKTTFWSLSASLLLLYLLGLIGHWPGWCENALQFVGFPWSLLTFDISLWLEVRLGFGWICFASQTTLFSILPAALDSMLVNYLLRYLEIRRVKSSTIPPSA